MQTDRPTDRQTDNRYARFLAVVTAAALFGVLSGIPIGSAVAETTSSSSWESGTGHGALLINVQTNIYYENWPTSWNARKSDAWMDVTAGDARCDRGRIFSNGWTQIGNKNWAGSPFPFDSSDGLQYDYFTWGYPAANYTMRSWWQVDDTFDGVVCAYGGGAGVYRNSQWGSDFSEQLAGP